MDPLRTLSHLHIGGLLTCAGLHVVFPDLSDNRGTQKQSLRTAAVADAVAPGLGLTGGRVAPGRLGARAAVVDAVAVAAAEGVDASGPFGAGALALAPAPACFSPIV